MTRLYSISRAADMAEITIHQARNYLYAGLIGQAERSAQGWYRLNDGSVRRLRMIGLATHVGVPLRDMAPLLSELDRNGGPLLDRVNVYIDAIERILDDRRGVIDEFSKQLDRVCPRPRCGP